MSAQFFLSSRSTSFKNREQGWGRRKRNTHSAWFCSPFEPRVIKRVALDLETQLTSGSSDSYMELSSEALADRWWCWVSFPHLGAVLSEFLFKQKTDSWSCLLAVSQASVFSLSPSIFLSEHFYHSPLCICLYLCMQQDHSQKAMKECERKRQRWRVRVRKKLWKKRGKWTRKWRRKKKKKELRPQKARNVGTLKDISAFFYFFSPFFFSGATALWCHRIFTLQQWVASRGLFSFSHRLFILINTHMAHGWTGSLINWQIASADGHFYSYLNNYTGNSSCTYLQNYVVLGITVKGNPGFITLAFRKHFRPTHSPFLKLISSTIRFCIGHFL